VYSLICGRIRKKLIEKRLEVEGERLEGEGKLRRGKKGSEESRETEKKQGTIMLNLCTQLLNH